MILTNGAPLFGLIVHASARRVRRRHLRRDRFWEGLMPPEAVFVTRHQADLDAAMAVLRERGVRAIACLGGDGSMHCLVAAMLRHFRPDDDLPVLLPLEGGTLSGLARAFGTGGRAEGVVRAALAELAAGRVPAVEVRLLEVSDPSSAPPRYGFTFAAGTAARAAALYDRKVGRGIPAAVEVMLAAFLAIFDGRPLEQVELVVTINGELVRPAPHTVAVGVVERPFLWFTPFGQKPVRADEFRLVTVSMRPREMALRLWQIIRGRCRHPGVRLGAATALAVCGKGGYVIDGELFFQDGDFGVQISTGPTIRIFDARAMKRRAGRASG